MQPSNLCLTLAKVAERWEYSASLIRRMIDNGELLVFRIGGKPLYDRETDVQRFGLH